MSNSSRFLFSKHLIPYDERMREEKREGEEESLLPF